MTERHPLYSPAHKLIDLNEGQPRGYVLFVLYAPGHYAPCPSVFLSDIEAGATPWAMHFTHLYECIEYVETMKRNGLVDNGSKLFIRDQDHNIVWRNPTMLEANSRRLAAMNASDKEESHAAL